MQCEVAFGQSLIGKTGAYNRRALLGHLLAKTAFTDSRACAHQDRSVKLRLVANSGAIGRISDNERRCPCASLQRRPQETARPQLKLERELDENRAPVRAGAPTFARAHNIEGTIDERLILRGDAEIRRAGTVVRGETITYTQATDIVNVEGHARVFRDGASFAGPRLDFRVDAQTGTMPDADFTYAARRGRGSATLVEFLGSDRARMENARFTTCGPVTTPGGCRREDRIRWTR